MDAFNDLVDAARTVNVVDAGLLVVLLLSLWSGYRRGFFVGLLEVASLVASVVAAFFGYPYVAAWLEHDGMLTPVWSAPSAFLLVVVAVRIACGLLAGLVTRRIPPRAHAHPANRLLGLLPGMAHGVINAVVAATLLLALPLDDDLTRSTQESRLAVQLDGPGEWAEAKLSPIFAPAVERTVGRLTVQPESTESITLKFKVEAPVRRPELEAAMLVLVNEARAAEGLNPLQADAETAEVAAAHSRDMFAQGNFAHVSPDGKSLADRLRPAAVRYLIAGENLALARNLKMAHGGLMDSPGHRANILRPAFGRVGIGVLDGGRHGLMVTQVFRN